MDRRPDRTLDETRLHHLRRWTRLGDDAPRGVFFLGAIGILLVALVAAWLLQRYVAASSIGMVFLTAVLATAIAYGLWPSLFAALLSALAYNFLFLPPLYSFDVAAPENIVALLFFSAVAIVAANLAARARESAFAAAARARVTEQLYLFSRKLADAVDLDDALWVTVHQVARMLSVRVVLLLPDGPSLAIRAAYPPEDILSNADFTAAQWAFTNARTAGAEVDLIPGAKWLFLPMGTGHGTLGVLGLEASAERARLTPEARKLLDALIDQAASAIARINLAADAGRVLLLAETERLRTALLTSISHDLRTPLASILGAATSLRAYGAELTETAKHDLTGVIQDEAERLNRFIANLLDMTRLESGELRLRRESIDIADIVGSALARAKTILQTRKVRVEIAADFPMAAADPVLLEQVLFNLLDNAAKYSGDGSSITVAAHVAESHICLQITDEGRGIPPADVERIFDKFYRVHLADAQRAGTGLGLSIARGFVEAMGGTLVAANRTDKQGAVFTVKLPIA
jgi:two-component system sensor histidine kinase KdpD